MHLEKGDIKGQLIFYGSRMFCTQNSITQSAIWLLNSTIYHRNIVMRTYIKWASQQFNWRLWRNQQPFGILQKSWRSDKWQLYDRHVEYQQYWHHCFTALIISSLPNSSSGKNCSLLEISSKPCIHRCLIQSKCCHLPKFESAI